MIWRDPNTVYPNESQSKTCIRGIRILASVELDNLAMGVSQDEIVASLPSLASEAPMDLKEQKTYEKGVIASESLTNHAAAIAAKSTIDALGIFTSQNQFINFGVSKKRWLLR
jgi:uncharacterized protein (DUF433 family)